MVAATAAAPQEVEEPVLTPDEEHERLFLEARFPLCGVRRAFGDAELLIEPVLGGAASRPRRLDRIDLEMVHRRSATPHKGATFRPATKYGVEGKMWTTIRVLLPPG